MDEKGIYGFFFSWAELFSVNLPALLVALFGIVKWPFELLWHTIAPDDTFF